MHNSQHFMQHCHHRNSPWRDRNAPGYVRREFISGGWLDHCDIRPDAPTDREAAAKTMQDHAATKIELARILAPHGPGPVQPI